MQMVCEDRGFFLEITDMIRGFGLNIWKGVMERREDKIWARFIVEVSKKATSFHLNMAHGFNLVSHKLIAKCFTEKQECRAYNKAGYNLVLSPASTTNKHEWNELNESSQ